MKRFWKYASFALVTALAAACVLTDKDGAKTEPSFRAKGDATVPSVILVNGRRYSPGANFTNALRALLPWKKLVKWMLFWLS